MCDMSDLKLAELQMNEAMRENDFTAACVAWDRLTDLRREYAEQNTTHIPKSTH